jgi:hypothetical protein
MASGFGWLCAGGLVVLMTLIGGVALWRAHRRGKQEHRAGSPFCRQCGYDLRGNNSACPECGGPNTYYDSAFWSQR